VTVNGSPVALSSSSPDTALYTGTYTATAAGAVTVTATVSVGGSTARQTTSGSAVQNYSCTNVSDTFVDARPGGKVSGGASDSDDGHSLLNTVFPFTFYGQTYSQVTVSSNGFLTLGSTNGADAWDNAGIPNANDPNALVAPFWDDLNPAAAGDVYAGVAGTSPNRRLYIEWYGVPHYGSSGTGTFELSLWESTGEIRYHWLDTDFGDANVNAGASATAGVENQAGNVGRQVAFNQPLLTNDRAVSCTPTTTPPPPPAPSITTSSLADATSGVTYSKTLAATGGTPPYTWSLAPGSQPLPSGLTLDPSTGVISGTPSASGSYPFVVKVTDSASQSATKSLSINVADPLSIQTSSPLTGGTVGQPYSATIAATGGQTSYSWSVTVGSLPSGLSLNSSSGAITGTPSAAGTSTFTVQVRDSGSPARTDAKSFSITIVNPLTITTSSLPGGTVGVAYSQSVTASGGSGSYSWSVSVGGLPDGLGLTSGTPSATVSGTPTTAGTYSFTLQITDGAGRTASQGFSIVVSATAPLSITTTTLPPGRIGVAYSATLAATGGTGPYTWSWTSGSLPPGVGLSPGGTISGTPSKQGSYTFTVLVTDSVGATASRTFTLKINKR
jgi:hypothetical protein